MHQAREMDANKISIRIESDLLLLLLMRYQLQLAGVAAAMIDAIRWI